MYGWIIRLRNVIQKLHTAIFQGKGQVEDDLMMKGPYERVNEPVDMEVVYELNVIGKKTYDKLDVFKDFQADPLKISKFDLFQTKSNVAQDGESRDLDIGAT